MNVLLKLSLASIFMIFTSFEAYAYKPSNCQVEFKELDLCAQVRWVKGPLWGGFSQATVTYTKSSSPNKKVDPPKDLTLYVWMVMEKTQHGGRTPLIKKKSVGEYFVDQLQFMKMSDGHWEIRWRKEKTDEKKDFLAKYSVPLD